MAVRPRTMFELVRLSFFNEFLLEAANTGVTVQFSSGDSGDQAATPYGKSVNFPASDPWATGVGGTSTEIGGNGKIVFQTGWSNYYSTLTGDTWTPAPPGLTQRCRRRNEHSLLAALLPGRSRADLNQRVLREYADASRARHLDAGRPEYRSSDR